jgi:hypothetical protein
VFSPFLGLFLGEQGEQHLVPALVARLIALALRYQPPIESNVFVVDEKLHYDLRAGPPSSRIMTGLHIVTCSILLIRAAIFSSLHELTGAARIEPSCRRFASSE